MLLAEFSMWPMDKGESVGPYVARLLDIIDQSGLPYRLGPLGTCVEGEYDAVMAVIRACHEALAKTASASPARSRWIIGRGTTTCSIRRSNRSKRQLGRKLQDLKSIPIRARSFLPTATDQAALRSHIALMRMMSKFYNNVKTALLLGAMTGLDPLHRLVLRAERPDRRARVFAAIMNFVAYFFSDKIALMSMRAQEVGPEHELYRDRRSRSRSARACRCRACTSRRRRRPTRSRPAATRRRRRLRDGRAAADARPRRDRRRDGARAGPREAPRHPDPVRRRHDRRRDQHARATCSCSAAAATTTATATRWRAARADPRPARGGADPGGHQPLARVQRRHRRRRDRRRPDAPGDGAGEDPRRRQQVPLQVNPAFNSLFIAEPLNPMAVGR